MKALIRSTNISTLSTAEWLSVTGIVATAMEPSGCKVRILLKAADGKWKKWSGSAWVDAPTQALTPDTVLAEGNTKEELESATALDWLKDTSVHFAIALEGHGATAPKLESITISGTTGENATQKVVVTDPIPLTMQENVAVRVLSVTVDSDGSSGGAVQVEAATKDVSGVWSDWISLAALKEKIKSPDLPLTARAIKFRSTLSVPAVGTGKASLTSIAVRHRTDDIEAGVAGKGYMITRTIDIGVPARHAHLMVIRPPVRDSKVRAYCSLRSTPIQVQHEALGQGNGTAQTAQIAHRKNFAPHTFRLYFGGELQTAGYSVDQNGKVSFVAPQGTVVTASYQHNWEAERWTEMAHDTDYKDDSGRIRSQFAYRAIQEGDQFGPLGTFKINITQGSGHVDAELLGNATGKLQTLILRHDPRVDTIKISQRTSAGTTELSSDSWRYEESSRLLYVTGTKDAELLAAYDWLAPMPSVEALAAVLNR